jgi:hypothetical protein
MTLLGVVVLLALWGALCFGVGTAYADGYFEKRR